MSNRRAAIRAAARAARLLTALTLLTSFTFSCRGGTVPPRAAPGPGEIDLTKRSEPASAAPEPLEPSDTSAAPTNAAAIHFEDLPVTRLERGKVPAPNGANPSLGAANAPVVMQMWSDFECPFCARAHPVLTELMRAYAGKVRLVWHDYPLPFHAHARLAANAGREAYAEGGAAAFWKFHDAIYEAPETSSTRRASGASPPRPASTRPAFASRSAPSATIPKSSKTWQQATRSVSKARPRSS